MRLRCDAEAQRADRLARQNPDDQLHPDRAGKRSDDPILLLLHEGTAHEYVLRANANQSIVTRDSVAPKGAGFDRGKLCVGPHSVAKSKLPSTT